MTLLLCLNLIIIKYIHIIHHKISVKVNSFFMDNRLKNKELLKRKFPLRHNVSLGCEMENYIDTIGMYNKTLVVAVIVLFSISIYLQLRIQIYCFKCTYYSSKTCNQSNSVLKRRLNFFGKITYIKRTNTQRDERMINAALKSMS